jgi:MFS family permease
VSTRTLAAGRRTFEALAVPNYRRYVAGQALSVSGTWMQAIALTWLVLQLGGSGVVLGATAALQYLPLLLLGPLAGVLVDRLDKRRLLFVTQSSAVVISATIALLVATGAVSLWMTLVAALLLGFVNALDVPARQSFAIEMVGPDLLPNAVTLNSVLMNLGRVVGPVLAGVAIATIGIAPCFAVNALSYVALIVALALMDTEALQPAPTAPRERGQLRAGLRYVWANPTLRAPLLVMAVIGTFTYEFQVMLPVLARSTFDAGAGGLSVLLGAMGAGSVVGGLVAAGTITPSARRIGIAGSALGGLVIVAAAMPSLLTTALVLVAVGGASIAFTTLVSSTLQVHAAPAMRGRVVALYAVALLGTIPIGGPIMGALAQQLGGRAALATAGAVALATIAVAWRSLARADDARWAAPTAAIGVGTPDPDATERSGARPVDQLAPRRGPTAPDRSVPVAA